jgi:hypothetical protein
MNEVENPDGTQENVPAHMEGITLNGQGELTTNVPRGTDEVTKIPVVELCGNHGDEKVNGKCSRCGRPPLWTDPKQVEKLGMDYINLCNINGEPITVSGLCLALHTSRETLMNYEEKDTFFDTIKRLKGIAMEYAEKQMYVGKNAAGPIFSLKNFGWTDKTETDITSKGERVDGLAVTFVRPDNPKINE